MTVLDAVADVLATEVLDDRHELFQAIEPSHGGADHVHQLPALLSHVAPEHRPQRGIELEEPAVEQRGCVVGNRSNRIERVLNELLLSRGDHV